MSRLELRSLAGACALLAGTVSAPLVVPNIAWAQSELEEVVVTARKREETLLSVPLAVSAFSARQIEEIGASNLQDIAQFSPGLYFTQQGGVRPNRLDQVLRFRGMDTNTTNVTQQLSTMFIDGVYVASGAQAIGLQDVERVEVIRGPQSAFFGRSTFSGAVNYVTRRPGNEFKGRASMELADYSEKDVSVSLEGPLAADRLTGRLTARWYDKDGQYVNVKDPANRLGAESTKSISGTLNFTPVESLNLMARVVYFEDDDGAEAGSQVGSNLHNCPMTTSGPCVLQSHFIGELPELGAADIGMDTGISATQFDVLVRNTRGQPSVDPDGFIDHVGLAKKTLRTALVADWEAANGYSLHSVTAWNDEKANTLTDSDGRPSSSIFWLAFGERFIRDVTQELRLSSPQEGRFTWSLGANYFDQSVRGSGRVFWSQQTPDGFVQFSDGTPGRTDVTTTGIFGSVGFDILDNLNLSLEGRYQEDELEILSTVVVMGVLQNNPTIGDTFTNFLPRVILDWKPNDTTTLYLTYSKGNRPGTFNAGLLSLTPAELAEVQNQTGSGLSVDEEELINYEIGYKGSFLDGRVTSRLTAYVMDWKNQQTRGQAVLPPAGQPVTALCTVNCRFFTTVTSVGATDLQGIEWEGSWQASEMLDLSATANWAKSEFQVFDCAFCQRVTGVFSQRGNQSPRVPEFSATLSASLRGALNERYEWFGRADLFHTDKTYEEAFNLAYAGARTEMNLRFGLSREKQRVELFVANLLEDDDYPAAARNSDLFNAGFRLFSAGVTLPPKRTFGVRASFEF
jgi:iron complex outermembrane recepter protein